eukprot:TRINITY_DN20309_c0_g1_i4.p1 TRINITY_DN20309_c0_g1~~TRINITY_DN20309_c0_g1_i4.p1  ORF type:complete len:2705 (-),score=392.19 TRINITY_DN20309_c0_g1_i4:60-8174(-)
MYNTYAFADAVKGEDASPREKMAWAYREAASAMLATSVTTCGSFYANCLSIVTVVRSFGFFMATLVLWNFINVLVIFPSAILVNDLYIIPCLRFMLCCGKRRGRGANGTRAGDGKSGNEENPELANTAPLQRSISNKTKAKPHLGGRSRLAKEKLKKNDASNISSESMSPRNSLHSEFSVEDLDMIEKFIAKRFTPCLLKMRFCLIIISITTSLFFYYLAYAGFQLSSGSDIKVFEEEVNLGRLIKLQKEVFPASGTEDLRAALIAAPPDEVVEVPACPGRQNNEWCSGQGKCDTRTGRCACDVGFVGSSCSLQRQPGTLGVVYASPSQSSFFHLHVLSSPLLEAIPVGTKPGESIFFLENRGDDIVDWALSSISMGDRSWLALSDSRGNVPSREFSRSDFEYPGRLPVKGTFSVEGLPVGFNRNLKLTLTSASAGIPSQQLPISLQVVAPPALASFSAIPASATLPDAATIGSITPTLQVTDGFEEAASTNIATKAVFANYTLTVPYSNAAIRLALVPFSSAGAIFVNGVETGSVSEPIDVPVAPAKTEIQVVATSPISANIRSTYTIKAFRACLQSSGCIPPSTTTTTTTTTTTSTEDTTTATLDSSLSTTTAPGIQYVDGGMKMDVEDCPSLQAEEGRQQLASGLAEMGAVGATAVEVSVSCQGRRLLGEVFSRRLSASADVSYTIRVDPGKLGGVTASMVADDIKLQAPTADMMRNKLQVKLTATLILEITELRDPVASTRARCGTTTCPKGYRPKSSNTLGGSVAACCDRVPCPDGTVGKFVHSGCNCPAGHSGKVSALATSPFYRDGCRAPCSVFTCPPGYGPKVCYDTDNGARDSSGNACAVYTSSPGLCVEDYADADFSATHMCCACRNVTEEVYGEDVASCCNAMDCPKPRTVGTKIHRGCACASGLLGSIEATNTFPFYSGRCEAACDPAICPMGYQLQENTSGSDVASCCKKTCEVFVCPSGYRPKDNRTIGESQPDCCDEVDCPNNSVGKVHSGCSCLAGFSGQIAALSESPYYLGACQELCDPGICPAGYRPNRTTGTDVASCCNEVSCPPNSKGTAVHAGCTCNTGFTGVIAAEKSLPYFSGECREACGAYTCPDGMAPRNGSTVGNTTAICCDAVACPENSTGTSVDGGCTCDSDSVGIIVATRQSPFYNGSCQAKRYCSAYTCPDGYSPKNRSILGATTGECCEEVECPPNTNEQYVSQSCTCEFGYTGYIEASASDPYYTGSCEATCELFECPAGTSPKGGATIGASTALCCDNVSCPANSNGTSLPEGCTCEAGYIGSIAATTAFPYFSGSCDVACSSHVCSDGLSPKSSSIAGSDDATCCDAVACPANSAGSSVETGCTCESGYSGSIAAAASSPYYTGSCSATCQIHTCSAGLSPKVDQGILGTDDSTCCDAIACPANSTGTDVASGCFCDAGFTGEIDTSTSEPYYSGSCDRACSVHSCSAGYSPKAPASSIAGVDDQACCDEVACPTNSDGTAVHTGCTCSTNYSGSITATSANPYFSGVCSPTCALHSCSAGLSPKSDQSIIGSDDATCCDAVSCPADSTGVDVARGCTCDDGYAGAITAQTTSPYYAGECRQTSAVCRSYSCPAGYFVRVNAVGFFPNDAVCCSAVSCPANSAGIDVPTGCTCDADYAGILAPTSTAPYYSGSCQATCKLYTCPSGYSPKAGSTIGADTAACCDEVSCPEASTGFVHSGCVCNSGYSGAITPVASSPYFLGSCEALCTLHTCSDGWSPKSNLNVVGSDDAACCNPVGCPALSQGISVASDCACLAGTSGSISATSSSPYYSGSCSAVSCPAASTGIAVHTGCVCNSNYVGTITPTRASPYFEGSCAATCALHSCSAGWSPKLDASIVGSDDATCCDAVPCPVDSIGTDVASGCTCRSDLDGSIIASTTAPYYSGVCALLQTQVVGSLQISVSDCSEFIRESSSNGWVANALANTSSVDPSQVAVVLSCSSVTLVNVDYVIVSGSRRLYMDGRQLQSASDISLSLSSLSTGSFETVLQSEINNAGGSQSVSVASISAPSVETVVITTTTTETATQTTLTSTTTNTLTSTTSITFSTSGTSTTTQTVTSTTSTTISVTTSTMTSITNTATVTTVTSSTNTATTNTATVTTVTETTTTSTHTATTLTTVTLTHTTFTRTTTTTTLYCPGEPVCNGRGSCMQTPVNDSSGTDWHCECDSTYDGADCSARVCPACQNNATCAPGDQSNTSAWGCTCPVGFLGDSCEFKYCPGGDFNCSNSGDCNNRTGICTCFEGYRGDSCEAAPPKEVPLTNAIEITLLLGMKGYKKDNSSAPDFDPSVELWSAKSQAHMLRACADARADHLLMVREEIPCWIEAFQHWYERVGGTFPIEDADLDLASTALQAFMNCNGRESWCNNARALGFQSDADTDGDDWKGRLIFSRLRMKVNLEVNADVKKRRALRQKWQDFVDALNKEAPSDAGHIIMVSKVWTSMELEQQVLGSTVMAFAGSMLTSLVAVTVFTQNFILAAYVCLNILLVVGVLSGFLLNILAYEFGVIEAIGSTIFVGLSVDYCLHLAHGYNHAFRESSKAKTEHAVTFLGASIMGGALTTIAGCAFLTPCKMVLFKKLGWTLMMNAAFSVLYTFLFLAPLLAVAGPTGYTGSIYWIPPLRRFAPEDMKEEAKAVAHRKKNRRDQVHPIAAGAEPKAARQKVDDTRKMEVLEVVSA